MVKTSFSPLAKQALKLRLNLYFAGLLIFVEFSCGDNLLEKTKQNFTTKERYLKFMNQKNFFLDHKHKYSNKIIGEINDYSVLNSSNREHLQISIV